LIRPSALRNVEGKVIIPKARRRSITGANGRRLSASLAVRRAGIRQKPKDMKKAETPQAPAWGGQGGLEACQREARFLRREELATEKVAIHKEG